jgi:hypothetical protein
LGKLTSQALRLLANNALFLGRIKTARVVLRPFWNGRLHALSTAPALSSESLAYCSNLISWVGSSISNSDSITQSTASSGVAWDKYPGLSASIRLCLDGLRLLKASSRTRLRSQVAGELSRHHAVSEKAAMPEKDMSGDRGKQNVAGGRK